MAGARGRRLRPYRPANVTRRVTARRQGMALGRVHDRLGAWALPTLADPGTRMKAAGAVTIPAAVLNLSRTIGAGCFALDGLVHGRYDAVAV